MAGSKTPTKKGKSEKVHFAMSSDCEICQTKCANGEKYLRVFSRKKTGRGVVCKKNS